MKRISFVLENIAISSTRAVYIIIYKCAREDIQGLVALPADGIQTSNSVRCRVPIDHLNA